MGKAISITDAEFEAKVLKSDKPVLVDFWATWCGPCIMMAPVLDEVAGDYEGKVDIVKIDVDENPEYSAKFGIRSIPTMILFKNGEEVEKIVGAVSKPQLTGKLDAAV